MKKVTSISSRVLHVFEHVDFRNGHEGLADMAKKEGIKVATLEPGEYVLFINSARDRLKLYAANHVVAYYKHPHGRLDMNAVALIPRAFRASGRLDYDGALKERLMTALQMRTTDYEKGEAA